MKSVRVAVSSLVGLVALLQRASASTALGASANFSQLAPWSASEQARVHAALAATPTTNADEAARAPGFMHTAKTKLAEEGTLERTPAVVPNLVSARTTSPIARHFADEVKKRAIAAAYNPQNSATTHIQHAIRAGKVQSRGVNLGGWLIVEYWMMRESTLWHGLSEDEASGGEQVAFTKTRPRETALERYKWHRDNFITEDEIAAIAAAGLNTVRVPVGYWILGFDSADWNQQAQWTHYAPGGLAYLDRLVREWAWKHNVAVMISMHGAKGSQNGADHSAPESPGKSFWSHYPENVASTLAAVEFLAARYKDDDAFLGIGLMNEPSGDTRRDVLYQYYVDAYDAIRVRGGNDCVLTIAPLLWEQSPWHMTEVLPGARNVWVEWHRYFVWGFEHASETELLTTAMDSYKWDVEIWKRKSDKPLFIGEFSLATAGKFKNKESLAEFGRRQLRVLLDNVNGGWTFWSWRIYGDEYGINGWSLRNLLRNGVFPKLA